MIYPVSIAAPQVAAQLAAAPVPVAPGRAETVERLDLFFVGRTHGVGTVRVATSSRPRILSVDGNGTVAPDGGIVLLQAVTIDGKTTQRRFELHRLSSNSWAGTLSDASGPVRATVENNRMTLAYPMKRTGMRMAQTLTLQPGGRTMLNRARVTLLGVGVATIDETITKLD